MSDNSFKKIPLKKTFNVTDVITILCYELAPSFSTEGETHDFWELLYVDRGRLSCISGDKSYHLSQGEVIFHKPNDFHSVRCDGTQSASIFIVSFKCTSTAMKFFHDRTFGVKDELVPMIKRLISECSQTFSVSKYPLAVLNTAPFGGAQLVKNYLEELLILLLRQEDTPEIAVSGGRDPIGNSLAHKIADYLKERVSSHITLEEISANFHYGKSSICDVFKRTFGDTIVVYHTKLKIDEAKRLIFEKKLTVSEVAERLGFESPEYFSRTFRRYTGMSPRDFRTRLVSDNTVYLESELKLV